MSDRWEHLRLDFDDSKVDRESKEQLSGAQHVKVSAEDLNDLAQLPC